MKYILAQGMGDALWSATKLESMAKHFNDPRIDILIAVWNRSEIESRAQAFLRSFSFVDSVELFQMPQYPGQEAPLLLPGPPADEDGHYRYRADGFHKDLPGYLMIANTPLESGIRLENWLPEFDTEWDIMDRYEFRAKELQAAEDVASELGPFVVAYTCCIQANSGSGHNRNALWTPEEWVSLGDGLHEKYGVNLIVVGADYDRDYWSQCIAPLVRRKPHWHQAIGQWQIGQTLAVIKRARMMVSYQSGLGVTSHMMGTPTCMWWRPKGDSISPASYVSPDEDMATAWIKPESFADKSGDYLPMIYGRESVEQILAEIERREW